eukprot:SAG22_NODE_15902_length_337_cov_1.067227_1_plen_54_part_10
MTVAQKRSTSGASTWTQKEATGKILSQAACVSIINTAWWATTQSHIYGDQLTEA